MAAERTRADLPFDLRRKHISGRDYLYRIFDRGGNGQSLGPMTPEREVEFENYHARKQALKEQIGHLRGALDESAALYRPLRLPLLSTAPGPILRECDTRQILGHPLLVVGTNAIGAYMDVANGSNTPP